MEKAFFKYSLALCVILFSAFGLFSAQTNFAKDQVAFLQPVSGSAFTSTAELSFHSPQQIAYSSPILEEHFKIEATEIVEEESETFSSKKYVDSGLFLAAFVGAIALQFTFWFGRKSVPANIRLADALVLRRYVAFQDFRI